MRSCRSGMASMNKDRESITSTSNPKVKYLRSLQKRAKHRVEAGAFVVEGVRLAEEAQKAGVLPQMVLHDESLSARGWQVVEAMDAEEGIQVAREQLPALILMDIQLPGMDGLSATRIINGDPQLKNIPVVALTSYAMQGDMDKAKQAGCAGYITKPIDTRNFAETIEVFSKPQVRPKSKPARTTAG